MPSRTAPPEPPADTPVGATPPDAAPGAATAAGRGSAFFGWLRALDLPRRPGWLGGVCAGIADRLGVDPILVRGIAVVLAVIGAPIALLYAIAWFLLPDEQDTIPAEELVAGRVTRAFPGIVLVFLASFLPLARGFWSAGALYWGVPGWGGTVLRILWTVLLIAAAVVAVVWLARRAGAARPAGAAAPPTPTAGAPDQGAPDQGAPAAPAPSVATTEDGAAPDAVAASTEAGTVGVAAQAAAPAALLAPAPVADPGEPAPPPADASAEELAAWRASQDEWRRQRALWTAEQRRGEQDRRRAEARARAAAAAEARRERLRLDRLSRPRAGAGVVALVVGVALVAGAVAAWIAQSSAPARDAAWMIGAAVLALVVGLGIVVVGLARRRSGPLSCFGILAAVLLALSMVSLPATSARQLLPIGGEYGIGYGNPGSYAQLSGSTRISVFDHPRVATPAVVDLWQYDGPVRFDIEPGATVRVEFAERSPRQRLALYDCPEDGGACQVTSLTASADHEVTIGDGDPDLVVRLWAGAGTVLDAVTIPTMTSEGDPE